MIVAVNINLIPLSSTGLTKWRNPYNWYMGVLVVLNALPILAPVLLALGKSASLFNAIAKLIYLVYSFTCHQFNHRSLYLFDYQYAWCARDVGIWMAVLAGAIATKRWNLKPMPIYWVIPFIIPIALDGGIQTIATVLGLPSGSGSTANILYVSNDLARFVTGAIFGLGLSLFISPLLMQGVEQASPIFFWANLTKKQAKVIGGVIICLIGFYTLAVAAWSLTSMTHKPTDFLDSAVRTPANKLLLRRADAICPTTETDFFNLECFFK